MENFLEKNKIFCQKTDNFKTRKLILTELSKIVGTIGPSDKILTRSDLNYFTSDPMSGAIFQ